MIPSLSEPIDCMDLDTYSRIGDILELIARAMEDTSVEQIDGAIRGDEAWGQLRALQLRSRRDDA